MSKNFTSHAPRPARPSRTGRPQAKAASRSVTREQLDASAQAKTRRQGLDAAARSQPGGAKPRDPEGKKEVGGPEGPEPTRFGDWERKGICYDF
ncbi:MAG: DUF1674 domain-containing protein [Rhodovibrionaceae bacterium]|nr:DUF1674 domain-containing protein [Rhodovibrionaceae bacterium]